MSPCRQAPAAVLGFYRLLVHSRHVMPDKFVCPTGWLGWNKAALTWLLLAGHNHVCTTTTPQLMVSEPSIMKSQKGHYRTREENPCHVAKITLHHLAFGKY